MAFHSQGQDEGSVQTRHHKQESALKAACGTPPGRVAPVDGVRAGAPAPPSTGGPVRRDAGMHPGPGLMAAEGRMGGREPEAGPAGYLPTLSGRVPAVSTSTQRWAGAGEAAASFPSTWTTTLWPPEQGGMASWSESNQNTCLRVSGGGGWSAASPE